VQVVQMFVLGPRLILTIREHHAGLLADFEEEPAIFFQDGILVSTRGGG
jgi:hypothetical protein